MANLIKKIRTDAGDLQIDYTALANLPSYAASSTAGGPATSANKLNTNAGTATQPVYFEGGVPKATTYTLAKSVPANAVFTDTTYTLSSFGITATAAELNYVDGVTSNVQTQLNGKAASSHNHDAGNITSGTLPIARGGTGATTVDGVLTNLGNIGKLYVSKPSAVSVPVNTLKTVASLSLPAGTYIVVANSQWPSDLPSTVCLSRLVSSDESAVYGTTRGFMPGGGGSQTTAIVSLTAQTTINYQVYHGHSAALNSEAISLSAVKLK